ncbi:MAG: M23 family metallopeptidase [Syntrophomonadaceae bacterium]|nr:M23 family metallopeptidase [Syntrophomonadaceae bacterium]
MVRTFKLKMLGVIVLVALVGFMMQANQNSRQFIQPILSFIMDNQYDARAVLGRYVQIPGWNDVNNLVPASGDRLLRKPCEILGIQSHFGWHWDQQAKKNQFNPGMQLKVVKHSEIRPMLSGQVAQITVVDDQKTVLIQHDNNLYSLYGDLQEITVKEGSAVQADTVLGKTGDSFYFEVRGKDGPVNPQSIFQ